MISLKEFLGVPRSSWRFKINNYCNLHCEHCATLCHMPINPQSEYVDRRDKWEMSIKTIELFCERFKGIGEHDPHRFSGGEMTAMRLDKLEEMIEIFHNHGRTVWILTNGYNLMGLSLECLNRIGSIVLDDHGINHELIMRCHKYLKKVYKGSFTVLDIRYHWNWDNARQHSRNILQKPCGAMMRSPSVYRGVIYPCCMSMHTDGMRGDGEANRILREAGWTFYNPDIVETLGNWRTTLPKYVLEKCLTDCPRPHNGICGGKHITLKQNDVIEGPQSKRAGRRLKND